MNRQLDLIYNLLLTTKFPAMYENLSEVCTVGLSHVPPHQMFGGENDVGDGLIAMRDLKKGEKLFTILETDVNVEVKRKNKTYNFDAFDYGDGDVIVTLEPDAKPELFYLQHDDVGNVKVGVNSPHINVHTCNCLFFAAKFI